MPNGVTERLCEPTTLSSGKANLGLESAQERAVTEPSSVPADILASAAMPLSSAPRDVRGLQLQLRSPPAMWAAHMPTHPISLFIDNQAALAVIQNDSRGRNRHFDIRLQFVRFNIDVSKFLISYCPSDENLADGGTKALNRLKQEISARRILNLPTV